MRAKRAHRRDEQVQKAMAASMAPPLGRRYGKHCTSRTRASWRDSCQGFLDQKTNLFGYMGCDFRTSFSNDSTESGSTIWLRFWGRLFDYTKHAIQIPDPFFSSWSFFSWSQATAVWRWSNFLHEHVPPGEVAVCVNLDETNIKLYQKAGPGVLMEVARKKKQTAVSLTHHAKKGDLRGSFTHVGMICDDPELQPLLPQHIFLHRNQISETDFEAAQGATAPNVILHRSDRTWITSELMKVVLKSLADAINAKKTGRRILLSLDTYRAHISQTVWRSAAAHGIFMFVVPAQLTWCLQPCDTHVFAMFKDYLSRTCQELAINQGGGSLTVVLLLQALNTTVLNILNNKTWRKAFDDLGYRGTQRWISTRAMAKLEIANRPTVGACIPTLQQLQYCWPRGSIIPIGDVFSGVLRCQEPHAPGPHAILAPPPQPVLSDPIPSSHNCLGASACGPAEASSVSASQPCRRASSQHLPLRLPSTARLPAARPSPPPTPLPRPMLASLPPQPPHR